jgi:electron transfer flavoprotein beta subunit
MPVVITATKELNKPGTLPINIMKAAKKQITLWNHIDMECDMDRIGLKGSPTVVKEIFEPVRKKINTIIFKGKPEEVAKDFVDLLQAEKLL